MHPLLRLTPKTFTTKNFRLQSGKVLPEVTIAYRTLGVLAPDRDNVVLVTHGNTSGPQMIAPGGSTGEGSWSEIIGPGKAVDTDRFFAICPNMLGSSYGSTNAASFDPATGRRYGPRFPDITVSDIVATQRAMLDHLGIERLVAIVGPSYGGFQAFQWAVNYPGMMKGIAAVVTSPALSPERSDGNVGAPARHPDAGPELERRRLLRCRRRAGGDDQDPHRHAQDLRHRDPAARYPERSRADRGGDPRRGHAMGAGGSMPTRCSSWPRRCEASTSRRNFRTSRRRCFTSCPGPTGCFLRTSRPA